MSDDRVTRERVTNRGTGAYYMSYQKSALVKAHVYFFAITYTHIYYQGSKSAIVQVFMEGCRQDCRQ